MTLLIRAPAHSRHVRATRAPGTACRRHVRIVGPECQPCMLACLSPQYWLVGRQVKCHPAAASHAVEGEVVDPGTSARSQRSCLQKLRTCSRTTSYQRNGIVVNGKSSLAYPRGPCLQYCMSIWGNTLTDALHAAHFELLVSSVQDQVGWSVFLILYPGQHYVCVCVRACFHIVLHVSGISGIQITSLEHMLASLSLFVSCLLVLARLRRDPLLPCLTLCSRLYRLIGLSFFVLMHIGSSFGICQGMSWQHLHQP